MSKGYKLDHRLKEGVLYKDQEGHDKSSSGYGTEDRRNNTYRTNMDKKYARDLVSNEDAAKWLINKGALPNKDPIDLVRFFNEGLGEKLKMYGTVDKTLLNNHINQDKGTNKFGKEWLKELKEKRQEVKKEYIKEETKPIIDLYDAKEWEIRRQEGDIIEEEKEPVKQQDYDGIKALNEIWDTLGLTKIKYDQRDLKDDENLIEIVVPRILDDSFRYSRGGKTQSL